MNNQDIPGCSEDSDIKTRKRKLERSKQRELDDLANNLDEISDSDDPYSSDDSVYDKAYDPKNDSEIDESENSLDCESQLDETETMEETQIVQSSSENDEEVVSNTIADQRNISDEEPWETNRRGEETKPETTRSIKNNKNNRKELTVSELRQFLGLCCLGGTVTDPSDHKDGTQHYLEPIPDTAKNSTVMRRCEKCANKQIRKQSRYLCPLCPGTPTLCVHPCFREWHEK
ncbi:hypothetical protein JTB14_003049 [Gonioctena quinquepunctata]|nr:hypothetical protein JTB14_003049 [Gonioctena quinquepunctata]